MPLLVEKGDTIYIDMDGFDSNRVNIQWRQNGDDKEEIYIPCKYSVKSSGSSEGPEGHAFIQLSKLDKLEKKHNRDGKWITVVVDDEFQYGQNEGRTDRFLVFHDKKNRMYQHRFVPNMLTKLGGGIVQDLKKYRGDYLHDF